MTDRRDLRHAASRVFTIPPGASFLRTTVDALLGGALVPGFSEAVGPLGLADATIYVPSRRSAQALAACFAERLASRGTFLPRIVPIGDFEAIEEGLLLAPTALGSETASEIPPAINPVARRLLLMRLILAWARSTRATPGSNLDGQAPSAQVNFRIVSTPVDAWHLAGELAGLLDEFGSADLDVAALDTLGTETFDAYWALTLDFLKIATVHWPAILAELGRIEPTSREKWLVEAEVARLKAMSLDSGPVIVAGAVGSDPLTTRLLAAIASLPKGAVILPGLDQALDETSWALIGAPEGGHGHPQFTLHRVLHALKLARSDVATLGDVSPSLQARRRLVSEALRPAETTEAWQRLRADPEGLDLPAALGNVALIEAAHETEEAIAIAIAMREVLEGDRSAVLVTPDRALARRVREELMRWGIEIDDSGGEPLATTPAGALAQLVLDYVTDGREPVALAALLAHPAVRLGRTADEVDRLRRRAEMNLLRGVLPRAARSDARELIRLARLRASEKARETPDDNLGEDRLEALDRLLVDLEAALAPLSTLTSADLMAWMSAHERVVAALTTTELDSNALGGPDGSRLAALFSEFAAHAQPGVELGRPGYSALFGSLAIETIVRGPARSHPRLKILGLLEFRLLDADRVILGGLDEGIWPPQARSDAFLNRPMRTKLGLALPEERISQFAHDFEVALGQPEVMISRAAKRGGSPTVPSRFLQRLAAVAGSEAWQRCRMHGRRYVAYARALDRPDRIVPIGRPVPKPPVELRPTSLSVTRIETLRRDPYAIYAEKILQLRPLDPIGASVGPREWGTAFHGVLRSFIERVRHDPVPSGALAELIGAAQTVFEPLLEEPHTRAFMAPRLDRWVRAFHDWHENRRAGLAGIHVEAEGRLVIPLEDGSDFELRATADRIERHASGGIRIVDYKTGAAPSRREVAAGFAPQLTLEAAIALGGGFAALDAVTSLDDARYVRFGTGREVDETTLTWPDRTLDEVVDEHLVGLRDLLNAFRDPNTGYVARPYPQFLARFGDYDHLSRVKEWSSTGGFGDTTGEAAE